MSGFTGKTKEFSGTPSEIRGLRGQTSDFLSSQLGQLGVLGESDLRAYDEMFKQRGIENLALAKEASGNLTGSGFANTLGKAAGRSTSEQGAFLAQLQEASKNRLAGILTPFLTAGVSSPQQAYQPGFLDYAFKAAELGAGALPFLKGPAAVAKG